MAVKTVNVQGFDATMALGRTAEVRQGVNNNAQSFGEVLNKAGNKVADQMQVPNSRKQTQTAKRQRRRMISRSKSTKHRRIRLML